MIAILINREGKREFSLRLQNYPAWIFHAGRRWGFGSALLSGERFYFEV